MSDFKDVKNKTYYPHYSGTRDDRRLLRALIKNSHARGIYFSILEILNDINDYRYPLDDIPILSRLIGYDNKEVEDVIKNYELFEIIEDFFFSRDLIISLIPSLRTRASNINKINKRWGNKEPKVTFKDFIPQYFYSNTAEVPPDIQLNKELIKEKKKKEKKELSNVYPWDRHTQTEQETKIQNDVIAENDNDDFFGDI